MNQEEFFQALSQLADRDISPELFQKLEEHLLASEEARNDYREFIHLQSLIGLEIDVHLRQEKAVPIEKIISRQKRRAVKVAVLSAAAIFIIGLVTMRLFFVSEKAPTLVFETSPGTQFELTHSGTNDDLEGAVLENGSHLTLSQGTVELTFASGVKSIVMAPADLTLHDDDTLFLNQGTAWFQVPKGAEGFTVKTHDLDIVDLGTEFGVLSKPGEHDEVHVLKGKVEVTVKRVRKQSATLVAGEARRIDPVGRLTVVPVKATAFLNKLPKTLPYIHWSYDELKGNAFLADGMATSSTMQYLARPRVAGISASDMQVQGKFGKAVSIDTKAKKYLLTDYPGIAGSRPRTIAFWCKSDRVPKGSNGLISWGRTETYIDRQQDTVHQIRRWKINIISDDHRQDQHGRIQIIGTGHLTGITNVCDGQWHHVACTYQAKQDGSPAVRLFIDGKEESLSSEFEQLLPDTVLVTEDPDASPVSMGSQVSGMEARAGLRTLLDEVYIFEGVMSEGAILRLMHENTPHHEAVSSDIK